MRFQLYSFFKKTEKVVICSDPRPKKGRIVCSVWFSFDLSCYAQGIAMRKLRSSFLSFLSFPKHGTQCESYPFVRMKLWWEEIVFLWSSPVSYATLLTRFFMRSTGRWQHYMLSSAIVNISAIWDQIFDIFCSYHGFLSMLADKDKNSLFKRFYCPCCLAKVMISS